MASHLNLPPFVLTDSYKWSHYALYPDAQEMTAYGEFRHAFKKDPHDHRIIVYGIQYIIEHYIRKPWTQADLIKTRDFANTHHSGYSAYPFPIDLFQDMINENGGYFPVVIEALPEGSIVYPHVPIFQITAKGKYSRLVTYLETLMSLIWYPTTVATLSRRCKDIIAGSFIRTVDGADPKTGVHPLLGSRLHDFGFRGCTSVEQAVIGGSAHLLNFQGSDTLAACYYVQYHLNQGVPVGTSIPATEHSVMMAWPSEFEAMANALDKFGSNVVACVMDSYDYVEALEKILPSLKSMKLSKGGFLVLRPDSGDPAATVLQALHAADKTFGSTVNTKGYKVLRGVGVVQGDGLDEHKLQSVVQSVEQAGYSIENMSFGMGGGLLQKVNRETMSFATKLNYIKAVDGTERDVLKLPKTDLNKTSLPGKLQVTVDQSGLPMVHPREGSEMDSKVLMRVVYDGIATKTRLSEPQISFSQLKAKVEAEWNMQPKLHDPISHALKLKQAALMNAIQNTKNKEVKT